MVADITGKRVVTSPDRGTTARGVTIMALKALGVLDSLHALPAARNDTYKPDPALSDRTPAAATATCTISSSRAKRNQPASNRLAISR